MGRVCSRNVEERDVYWLLVENPEGKKSLGRQRHRSVDNIKMNLGDI
jgi:hypothetical protein